MAKRQPAWHLPVAIAAIIGVVLWRKGYRYQLALDGDDDIGWKPTKAFEEGAAEKRQAKRQSLRQNRRERRSSSALRRWWRESRLR